MNILIFSPDSSVAAGLRVQLPGGAEREIFLASGDALELGRGVERADPKLLVVDGFEDVAIQETVARIVQDRPAVQVVLLSSDLSPEFLLRVMRMGVTEVLPRPASPVALQEAVARAERRVQPPPQSRAPGKVVAVIGCKGGSGVTFLASNLAYAVASQYADVRVILIDLNLQGGDAELFVSDTHANSSVGGIAQDIQRLDQTLLEASLIKVLPNFGVLAAVHDTHEAFAVKPEHVAQLLDVAAGNYDLIVLDMPRVVDPVTVKALDRAAEICLVMQMPLPFIRDAKKLLGDFRSLGYGTDKVHIVVNRYEADPDITLKDLEHAVGMQVYRTIPNSYRHVTASVNQGVPIVRLEPRDPVSRTLLEMAARQMHVNGLEQHKSWLSKLTGK